VAFVLDGEDFCLVALACVEVRIAGLELQIDAFAARLPCGILELDFAVDPPVGVRGRPENLPGLPGNGKCMADENKPRLSLSILALAFSSS
jgi:hypothetical protein